MEGELMGSVVLLVWRFCLVLLVCLKGCWWCKWCRWCFGDGGGARLVSCEVGVVRVVREGGSVCGVAEVMSDDGVVSGGV